mmetsp:Transcript_20/g.75  ORF Transcript_20/g.75 Transcript_20/m.75 type:complete len:594 (+) Transcript_20:143-1924(+)
MNRSRARVTQNQNFDAKNDNYKDDHNKGDIEAPSAILRGNVKADRGPAIYTSGAQASANNHSQRLGAASHGNRNRGKSSFLSHNSRDSADMATGAAPWKAVAAFAVVSTVLLVFPEARYLATGDELWLQGKQAPMLHTHIGPVGNRVINYVRWIFAAALLVFAVSSIENKIHNYARSTERSINERRATQMSSLGSNDGEDTQFAADDAHHANDENMRSKQLLLVDMFLVKVLLVFFPSVEVQRMSFAQAVRAATFAHASASDAEAGDHRSIDDSNSPPLRRFVSMTVEHGVGLLSFHRGITRTNTPLTERLISWCTWVALMSLTTLGTMELTDPMRDTVLKLFKASMVLRIFVPLSAAAAVIMEDLIMRSGSQSILKDSWRVLTSAVQMCLWLVTAASMLAALGFDMSSYVAGLGISSIAAAFAAQAALRDMIATASLLADHPFGLGDRVVYNDTEAIVRRIGFRSTHFVTTYNGETMVIPNSELITGKIFNRTKMRRRRVKNHILVHYDVPPQRLAKVSGLIETAFTDVGDADFVYAHLMELGPHGARFEYVFEVQGNDSKIFKDAQHAINLYIYQLFANNSIKFTMLNDAD